MKHRQRTTRIGLAVSTILHAGVLGAVVWPYSEPDMLQAAGGGKPVNLTASEFVTEEPQPAVSPVQPKPEPEPEPEP
ncbi:hypothetical protein LPW28_06475, partial [Ectothiorhodospira sp. 9905]|nr:hypothetical protein [Ectothiorhodospira sp. 9905]